MVERVSQTPPDGLERDSAVSRQRRVLLIGPLPPQIGGDTRLFAFLVSDLTGVPGFHVDVIDSSRGRRRDSALVNCAVMIRTLWSALIAAPRADVISFHASDRGMATVGPLLFMIARVFRKRYICRLFGGSFDAYYDECGALLRGIICRTVLAADVCLFETKRLVDYFAPIATGRVEWFSNYTRLAWDQAPQSANQACARLIFLGHLWKTKGIDILLESLPLLPAGVTIDLYGPLDDYSEAELIGRGRGRIVYRGVLTNDQVLSVLPDYHALVLPTFHEGEGYPGVVIEAFARGVPVIASRWRSIPEIVDESCGILVEAKSVEAFADGVRALHEDRTLLAQLRRGALARSQQFDNGYWTQRFAEFCAGN